MLPERNSQERTRVWRERVCYIPTVAAPRVVINVVTNTADIFQFHLPCLFENTFMIHVQNLVREAAGGFQAYLWLYYTGLGPF